MITVACVGNRYLEMRRQEDGAYEVRIMAHRGKRELLIATLVIESAEFDKLKLLFPS